MPNPSVKRDCGTGVVSSASRFRAAAPYLQRYPSMRLFIAAAFLATSFIASATDLDLSIRGGHFEDCEFVDIGKRGSLSGSLNILETATDKKWAAAATIILIQDTKPSRTFRLLLGSIADSKKLETRYEFFLDQERVLAEATAQTPVGVASQFDLSWDERGHIRVKPQGGEVRDLWLSFKPDRAFFLVSGAKAKISTAGQEKLDCSRSLEPGGK